MADRLVSGVALIAGAGSALAVLLGLAVLTVWSFAGFWGFPDALPDSFTMKNWMRHGDGAFEALGPMPVAGAAFLGIGKDMKVTPAPLADHPPDRVWDDFIALLRHWQNPARGYTARMAMFSAGDSSDYDHLSRFGEWDISDTPAPEDLA